MSISFNPQAISETGAAKTDPPNQTEIRPISHRSTNDKVLGLVIPFVKAGNKVADIGAGEGFFSKMVGEYVEKELRLPASDIVTACDIFPEYFRYSSIRCLKISSDGRLPYEDQSIDVACSLEVVEHVEDQFAFARELHRILKPGGIAIVSTPNVLNANSRWRFLHSGFAVLFDPLLLSSTDPVHTSGHINPVSYYYLAYQLRRAGFRTVSVEYDRFKNSARALLVLFGAAIWIGNRFLRPRLRARKKDVVMENEEILNDMWSYKMLISRSVIAVARK